MSEGTEVTLWTKIVKMWVCIVQVQIVKCVSFIRNNFVTWAFFMISSKNTDIYSQQLAKLNIIINFHHKSSFSL